MSKVAYCLVLGLTLALAACDDKKYNVNGPSPTPTVGPIGPTVMTMYMVKKSSTTWDLRLGGLTARGLVKQPALPDDSLATVTVRSFACGTTRFGDAGRGYTAGVNNSAPMLNADTTVVRDIDACSGNIEFELEFETFYKERIYHKLDDPKPLFLRLDGIAVPMEIRKGNSDNRGRLIARLD